ncbi:MAG: hypothetical protein CVU41_00425 [Chloroflexi bacterium HGW-Chloroflexi-3]|nr:MAG: hypothetical protein CVU41_00425 [Chloroflexi bacterium HGW-Chloroflexi-3]
MRTPYGQECRFFFGDYFRGRNFEECRLMTDSYSKLNWSTKICKSCPVPNILQANACQHMQLTGVIKKDFGFIKRVNVSAYCEKSKTKVKEPHVGCGQCHPLPDIFLEGK